MRNFPLSAAADEDVNESSSSSSDEDIVPTQKPRQKVLTTPAVRKIAMENKVGSVCVSVFSL